MLSKKDFTQAATFFISSKDYPNALEAYKSNGDWREMLQIAKILNYSEDQIKILVSDMAEYLNTMAKYTVKLKFY